MIDELTLFAGTDIPCIELGVSIHQPTLRQISYITEEAFWTACSFLKFTKDLLDDEDRANLSNKSNFDIIMMMMKEKNTEAKKLKVYVTSLLSLLFPNSKILLGTDVIHLQDHQTKELRSINSENYQSFKKILIEIFCLSDTEPQFNPSGDLAKQIAEKIQQGRRKRAQLAPSKYSATFLSRYISILSVGQNLNVNELMDYTIYQIMDIFKRFQLKNEYDTYLQYKCGNFTGMKQPENWFKNIHDEQEEKQVLEDAITYF